LAGSGIGTAAQFGLIGLFVLFYLLDELVVFGIAVSRMRLWLASPRVAVWAVLVEGLLLTGLGVWYLAAILR
jgi:threonine/homoserine/homoserine lactone efflux protein